MKKILLILVGLFFTHLFGYGQPPSTALDLIKANYYIAWEDDFTTYSSTTDPAFARIWDLADCGTYGHANSTIYKPSQVTIPTPGTLRIHEYICSIAGTVDPCTGTSDVIHYYSGSIQSHQQIYGPYGIMEVRINVPDGNEDFSIWMENFDLSILPIETFFHSYDPPRPEWQAHLQTSTCHGPCGGDKRDEGGFITNTTATPVAGEHLFSAMWEPHLVSFFLDGNLLGSYSFLHGRTNFTTIPFIISMTGAWWDPVTDDNLDLDIYDVKVWYKKCGIEETLNVSDVIDPTSGHIPGGEYKFEHIVSSDLSLPVPNLEIHSPVVFKAKSTLLLPNFVADETTIYSHTVVGDPTATIENSYLLILPTDCIADCGVIEGRDTICEFISTTFSNSTPAGTWSSLDPSIAIVDPVSGVVTGESLGTTTIYYTRADCIRSKVITVKICDGYKHNPFNGKTPNNGSPKKQITLAAVDDSTKGFPAISSMNESSSLISKTGDMNIYPSPTKNTITITYPCTSAGQLEISIKDVSGRTRYTESVSCNEGNNVQQVVDMSTFPAGVYFIDLTLNSQHVVKKIVKL